MNNEFPVPITSEADLIHYEKYLEQEFAPPSTQKTLLNKLECYIGGRVKIDLFSPYRADSRIGILKDIGQDYLVLKTQSQTECFIPFCVVKCITILQNNKTLPHF